MVAVAVAAAVEVVEVVVVVHSYPDFLHCFVQFSLLEQTGIPKSQNQINFITVTCYHVSKNLSKVI